MFFSTSLFMAGNSMGGFALLFVGVLAIAGALFGWNRAQSDTDLDQGHPTNFSLPDGTVFSVDARLWRDKTSALMLSQLWDQSVRRVRLPDAAGLVDAAVKEVVPGSELGAAAVVERVNKATQARGDQVPADAFQDEEFVAQPGVEAIDRPNAPLPPNVNAEDQPGAVPKAIS
ncbi:hypothetical protein J7E62_22180 [Variovorax paradoxus]|nr:hypothetical protein [Variovorax paradoxus]